LAERKTLEIHSQTLGKSDAPIEEGKIRLWVPPPPRNPQENGFAIRTQMEGAVCKKKKPMSSRGGILLKEGGDLVKVVTLYCKGKGGRPAS